MKIGVKVGDIMTQKFVAASPEMDLIKCSREMTGKKVGSLIVLKDGKLVGLITERDIIWALSKKKNVSKIKVKDVMARKVITIRPDRDLSEAMSLMSKTKIRWLPVVADNHVIGMLTIKDILRIEPSLFDIARQTMKIREESEKMKRRKTSLSAGEESWESWGDCEECENFGPLYKVNERLVCESCKDVEE